MLVGDLVSKDKVMHSEAHSINRSSSQSNYEECLLNILCRICWQS